MLPTASFVRACLESLCLTESLRRHSGQPHSSVGIVIALRRQVPPARTGRISAYRGPATAEPLPATIVPPNMGSVPGNGVM